MIWVGLVIGICLGGIIGFFLGIWGSRGRIAEERQKALEMAEALIHAREQADQLPVVHPSASQGSGQQFNFEVFLGGDYGTEE